MIDFSTCCPAMKKAFNMDFFRMGCCTVALALYFGSVECFFGCYHRKLVAGYTELDLTTHGLESERMEISSTIYNVTCISIILGRPAEAADILRALGFSNDEEGLARFEAYITAWKAAFPPASIENDTLLVRVLLLLSGGSKENDGPIDWLPEPERIAEMEKNCVCTRLFCLHDLGSFCARAFVSLGQDDNAAKLAGIIVSEEQNTQKKFATSSCFSILGQMAAKRGNFEEAEGHFSSALADARLSRLPMYELLAARDWKKHLLEPNGRDASEAEAAIDAACAKMNKSREQLAAVLLF